MARRTQLRAGLGLAAAQLRHDRARTVLAVLGIAFAVLAATMLASVGYGVVATGEETFDSAGRDLWISGGPVRITPGSLGGFEPTITDAHTIRAALSERDSVATAVPLLFQTVYVGPTGDAVETYVAVGVPSTTGGVDVTAGRGFPESDHYADGAYDGERRREVVVDPQTADHFDLAPGDDLHVGGTVVDARQTTYRVVGVSPTMSRFLGVPVVIVPLAELQSMTGTAHADQATLVTVKLADGADPQVVAQDLQEAYPRYDVRTNREQLQTVLQKQAVVVAGGVSLVFAAFVAGLALTVNLLTLLVYQQRDAIAAVRALGSSRTTIVSMVAGQALALGLVGGAIGVALTPPLAAGLDLAAAELVGFEGLVRTPYVVYALGAATAVLIGAVSAVVAGLRVARLEPLAVLTNRG